MNNVQHIHLGPENAPLEQGRSAHGRWRVAFQRAGETPADGDPIPAALDITQDSERLVFALAEGPLAEFLAGRLADHLWKRESADGNWPESLREWLADRTDLRLLQLPADQRKSTVHRAEALNDCDIALLCLPDD